MTSRTSRNEATETAGDPRPDAPPPEADAGSGVGLPPAEDDAPSPPPMSGSEATSTVARGTTRETGPAGERDGDAVDGSEGSASGSRTAP